MSHILTQEAQLQKRLEVAEMNATSCASSSIAKTRQSML